MEINTKDSIRKEILAMRNSLSSDEIKQKSRLITEKLLSLKMYKKAENILIYVSMGSEVQTDEIIEKALEEGKRVFCPKCTDTTNGKMEFVRITALSDLEKGYFGIREPVIDEKSIIFAIDHQGYEEEQGITCKCKASDTLIIMPLVAFDEFDNRIGYRGGYYDRYLSAHPDILTCALAFSEQRSSVPIPAEAHDIKPQMILTEK